MENALSVAAAGHTPHDESEAFRGGEMPKYQVWAEPSAGLITNQMAPIRHNFHLHPLMQMPQLKLLTKTLEAKGQCRFMIPGATERSSLEAVLRAKSPKRHEIDEVLLRLEEPGSWVALYNIETIPEYAAFLNEVVTAGYSVMQNKDPGTYKIGGYIFISAPPSVTPFHIDREHNFWLQLHGRKTISVWDRADRDVVAAKDVETFLLNGSLAKVNLSESMRPRATEFDCGPGQGVFFPSTSPHMTRSSPDWITAGNGVAVSIGVVFYTKETLREARVHLCNLALRKLGITPQSLGHRPGVDAIKAQIGRILARTRRRWPDVTSWSFGLLRD